MFRRMAGRLVKVATGLRECEAAWVIGQTLSGWNDDNVPRLGASLAFYTLLSAAPLLVIVVAVAALVYGEQAARGQLVWEIRGLVGGERAKAIQDLLQSAYHPGPGLLATGLGLFTLGMGATSVVVELRDAMNTIWHVPPAVRRHRFSGFLRLLRDRFYSFGLVLGGGVLLLLSLTLNAMMATLERFIGALVPAPALLLRMGAFTMSFLAIAFLFAAIYKMVPDVALNWDDVVVGAVVTSFLFEIGKQIIGVYLGRAAFGSAYGAAGSLVVLLVWIYYSAQVFFLGAEFTKVHTQMRVSTGKRTRVTQS